MSADPLAVIRDINGDVLALVDESRVWFAEQIEVLEKDHPRRRFTAMMALAAGVMQAGPEPEAYDPEVAAYYARYILIPDTAFILHRESDSDPELAERFNVPLEQVEAKHLDLAALKSETAA
jgi:hypothetical protein